MSRRARQRPVTRSTVLPDGASLEGDPVAHMPGTSSSPGAGGRRQRVGAYGLCHTPAGEILLVRAAPSLTVAGQWFLPGGGIEHGEDPVASLRREFTEETGLDVEVGDLLAVMSDTFTLPNGTSLHTVRIIYAIDEYRGTLRHEVGGSSDAARWLRREEALTLPLRPYVREVLGQWFQPDSSPM